MKDNSEINVFQNVNNTEVNVYHLNRRRNSGNKSSKGSFIQNENFLLKYMRITLIILGVKESFTMNQANNKNLFPITKIILFCAFHFTLIVQILTLLSVITALMLFRDTKYFVSMIVFRSFNIINRILLYKIGKKFTCILTKVNSLSYNSSLRSLEYRIIAFKIYVIVMIFVRYVCSIIQISQELLKWMVAINCFRINLENNDKIKIVQYIINFVWVLTEVIIPSSFTLVYILLCYSLKHEFVSISLNSRNCRSITEGRRILRNYATAVETGRKIDSALSLPLFFFLSYMLIMLFNRGYTLFVLEEMLNIYLVNIV